jgi:23S rRNA (adenine2030-N6)-methyltransferase
MNYRHAYHAGNFADVMKHATLALVIDYLKQKPTPFRVIDTHAAIGVYDLSSEMAEKTGEWREGIKRILEAAPADGEIAGLLAPYLDAVKATNGEGALTRYPGSPLVARHLMRRDDMLVVNELHPDEYETLRGLFARDRQVKVLNLDGWNALKALLPPKERRGVVLVDPPFEERGDLERLEKGLREAVRRFATGIFLLWYPIKDPRLIDSFKRTLAGLGLPKVLTAELLLQNPADVAVLNGCGLVIVNPPYQLDARLDVLLAYLARILGRSAGSGHRVAWLGEDARAGG